MSLRDIKKPEPVFHRHEWFLSQSDLTQERCSGCPDLKVSEVEYDRRIEEWNNYFQMVRSTESYLDYARSNQLLADRIPGTNRLTDVAKAEMIEIAKRAKAREEKNDYMTKPSFPDPSTWRGYVIA